MPVATRPSAQLLFCDDAFHDLNGVAPEQRWRFEHHVDGVLVGALAGVLADGVFESGHSAPFGGPDIARPDQPLRDVQALLHGAVAALEAGGAETIRIRARPGAYSPADPLVEYLLLNLGFAVEHCDLNQHVELAGLRTMDDYLAGLKKKRARDVRADLAEPYELREVATPDELATCHAILAANRAAHGRPPGLPAEYLASAGEAFPGRVHPYLLRHAGDPAAAAVVYRVLEDVDLLVAWGDHGHALQRSPMNLLAYLLIERSVQTGARIFDLGPSSEKDGSPNLGLVQFKRSVGAVPATRKVLTRSCSR